MVLNAIAALIIIMICLVVLHNRASHAKVAKQIVTRVASGTAADSIKAATEQLRQAQINRLSELRPGDLIQIEDQILLINDKRHDLYILVMLMPHLRPSGATQRLWPKNWTYQATFRGIQRSTPTWCTVMDSLAANETPPRGF